MAGNQLAQRSWLLAVADMAMIWKRSPKVNRLEVVAKAAVNNMTSGIIILDAQNIVLDLNQQAKQIINSVSVTGDPYTFAGKTARNALGIWPNLVAFLYSSNKEYQDLLKCDVGGELRYYDVHIEPVYSEVVSQTTNKHQINQSDLLVGRYIVLHDNTERERAALALQERKKQLRSMVGQLRNADRYQVALADSIQQELKEPLNKLSTIIDSLDQQAIPEQLAQDVNRIKDETLALQKIVEEMDVFSHHRRPPSFYAEPASKNVSAYAETESVRTESLRTESFH